MTHMVQIGKIGQQVEVKGFDTLPEASQAFLIAYGLKQVLNDAHASIQRKDFDSEEAFQDEVMGAVLAKVEALESGEVKSRGTGAVRVVDPFAKLCREIAKERIYAACAKAGKKKPVKEQLEAFIVQVMEKHGDSVKAEAKERLDSLSDLDLDLDF